MHGLEDPSQLTMRGRALPEVAQGDKAKSACHALCFVQAWAYQRLLATRVLTHAQLEGADARPRHPSGVGVVCAGLEDVLYEPVRQRREHSHGDDGQGMQTHLTNCLFMVCTQ